MENSVNILQNTITSDLLWNQFTNLLPFFGMIIIFGFGIGLIASILHAKYIWTGKIF